MRAVVGRAPCAFPQFAGSAAFGSSDLGGVTSLTSAGNKDVFAMRVDSSGAVVWAVSMGGTAADIGYAVASDGSGGAIVSGYFKLTATFGSSTLTSAGLSDVFVAHVTSAGPGRDR